MWAPCINIAVNCSPPFFRSGPQFQTTVLLKHSFSNWIQIQTFSPKSQTTPLLVFPLFHSEKKPQNPSSLLTISSTKLHLSNLRSHLSRSPSHLPNSISPISFSKSTYPCQTPYPSPPICKLHNHLQTSYPNSIPNLITHHQNPLPNPIVWQEPLWPLHSCSAPVRTLPSFDKTPIVRPNHLLYHSLLCEPYTLTLHLDEIAQLYMRIG